MSNSCRASIHIGQCVWVVQKQHQSTGELTRGIVAELLTNTANHPRGIKVRLRSGVVGRVAKIGGDGDVAAEGDAEQVDQHCVRVDDRRHGRGRDTSHHEDSPFIYVREQIKQVEAVASKPLPPPPQRFGSGAGEDVNWPTLGTAHHASTCKAPPLPSQRSGGAVVPSTSADVPAGAPIGAVTTCDSQWTCPQCTFINPPPPKPTRRTDVERVVCCEVCEGPFVAPTLAGVSGEGGVPANEEAIDSPSEWTCDRCTFINASRHSLRCEVCDAPRENQKDIRVPLFYLEAKHLKR